MKRWVCAVLALALCLATCATAFAGNDYSVLNGSDILRKGSRGNNVRRLQQALINLGYLSGKADGSYGSKTVAAVKEFQRKNGFGGMVGFGGVATMLTQAAIMGSGQEYAWSGTKRTNTVTGSYAVRNTDVRSYGSLTPSFTFVNTDSHNVEALCVYYWLADSRNRLVTIKGYKYWMQWYYGMNLGTNQTKDISVNLDPTNKEINKACTVRCIVGEIAYTNGETYINFNASKQPYEHSNYILGGWQ